MKKQPTTVSMHVLRVAFVLVLVALMAYVPRAIGGRISNESLKVERARATPLKESARADVELPRAQTSHPATPQVCTFDGVLGTAPAGGSTGTLGIRLFRGGFMTTCPNAPYPGTSGAGPYIYNAHNITNTTAAPLCTNVTLHYVSGGTAPVSIQVAAFQWPFSAADISNAARYLGDPGTSSGTPPMDTSFSVNVPANATIALVVFCTNVSPAGQNAVYQINLNQNAFCGPQPPLIVANGSFMTAEACDPANLAIDPGETVTVNLGLKNTRAGPTTNLVATLQSTGGVTNPSGPVTYGVIAPTMSANGSFAFTADPMLACGSVITATLALSDNGNSLPSVTFTFTTGTLANSFSENFDGVTPPALPAGWAADQGTNAAGAPLWVTSNAGVPTPVADTAPNATYSQDPANVCDNRLYTPVVMYPAGSQLIFKQNYDFEESSATVAFDAGVLEMNINGSGWYDIVINGGSFAAGGYNHTSISTEFNNPLLDDHCPRPSGTCGNWSGVSNSGAGGFETCVVNLPAFAAGMPVQFRWRMGSDESVSHFGWRVDRVRIAHPVCCTGATTAPIMVTSSADAGGICPGANCTLRQAIATAVSNDTINFAGGITTISLTSTELMINKNLTIKGPGANLLRVQRSAAAGNFRIFHISPDQFVTMSGLTIANGQLSGSSFPGSCGGGILNEQSTLTLRNCAVSGNRASLHGGAILNLLGAVALAGCTLDQNSATGSGGAILNAGYNGIATLILSNCTLNQNQAGQYGGAVYNDGTSSGNAQLTLTNCTLNQNTAASGASGIYNDALNPGSSGVANLKLQNTILRAGASGANLVNDNGTIVSGGHNLSSDAAGGDGTTGPGGFLNAAGDIRNTDPQLDPAGLANNGGPTMTIALQATSPAINGGDDNQSPPTDQRGYLRNGVSDIGAFEFNGVPIYASSAVSRKTHGSSGTFDVDLPLTGTTGVECRSGGATNDFTMVVTFMGNVTVTGSPQAQVTSGTGAIGSGGVSNGGTVTVSGNIVTIPLTNVADQQTINVTLNGVNNASIDQPAADVVIPMSRLLGDTNGNRSVNAGDVSQTKARIGQAVTSANFRSDINANGSINAGDVSQVKANSGHGVP